MNNPPAFPHAAYETNKPLTATSWHDGMTLRDYFAAAAITGMLCSPDAKTGSYEKFAEWSYLQADAMLKAREQ